MSVNHVVTAAVADLLAGAGPAAPAAAQALAQSAEVGVYSLTAGRFWGTAAALLGLVGVVLAGLAVARSVRRTGNNGGRRGAVAALVLGLLAVVGGALNLAVADGGPGTGNGVLGGVLALVLGLVALAIGGLVVSRSRHRADRASTA